MSKMIDLTGKRLGRLVVLRAAGRDVRGSYKWECLCDCGNKTIVARNNLKDSPSRPGTKSCGCWQREVGTNNRTHGKTGTPEYLAWCNMRGRCYDTKDKAYRHYGGRGITVCDRWHAFENFLADMGERPAPGYSIERNDVNGHYEPSNCRWATRQEQNSNTRQNTFITFRGEKKTQQDWANITGIPRGTIHYRLKSGWPTERALTTPVGPTSKRYTRRSAASSY
jgi:hypothetical protein